MSNGAPATRSRDFWEPIYARDDQSLILDPDEFYILASKEAVQVRPTMPPKWCRSTRWSANSACIMPASSIPVSVMRAPGGRGARAVLEVRSREVPFILEHGQIVGRLVYEKMWQRPSSLYGERHRLELPGAGSQAFQALPLEHEAPSSCVNRMDEGANNCLCLPSALIPKSAKRLRPL